MARRRVLLLLILCTRPAWETEPKVWAPFSFFFFFCPFRFSHSVQGRNKTTESQLGKVSWLFLILGQGLGVKHPRDQNEVARHLEPRAVCLAGIRRAEESPDKRDRETVHAPDDWGCGTKRQAGTTGNDKEPLVVPDSLSVTHCPSGHPPRCQGNPACTLARAEAATKSIGHFSRRP